MLGYTMHELKTSTVESDFLLLCVALISAHYFSFQSIFLRVVGLDDCFRSFFVLCI